MMSLQKKIDKECGEYGIEFKKDHSFEFFIERDLDTEILQSGDDCL